ncbi:MAG: hypothetical protein K2L17_11045 [Muribaculaceae bacterium]|nr:hypothetical protein [Muribaculaceae bacterium]
MTIKKIVSNRNFEKRSWWDIVYKWEDIISKELSLPIKPLNIIQFGFQIFQNFFNKALPLNIQPNNLRFVMTARPKFYGEFGRQDIPIIIDFFLSDNKAIDFLNTVKKQKIVLISSKEVYDYLINIGGNSHQIKHWALSLPDELAITPQTKFEKKYDLVLIGRLPKTFQNYVDKYRERHPSFSIVTKRVEDGAFNYYDSSGNYVGNANDYQGYIDILRKSRIYLYTTPGLDSDKKTNGFSQVTPRFLEVVSAGCNIIMHYPKNSDTDYFELPKFGRSIQTYEEFEESVEEALKCEPDMKFRSEYLQKHYTSVRSQELKNILNYDLK